jgi:hypothetical protein
MATRILCVASGDNEWFIGAGGTIFITEFINMALHSV